MADTTHTTRYVVEDLATSALAGIRKETGGVRADFLAGSAASEKFKASLLGATPVFEEVESKLEDAGKRMMEFGFSAEEAAAGLDLIVAASSATGEPIALTALRMEELAKETQSAVDSFKLFGLATQITQDTTLKVEEATAVAIELNREFGNAESATQAWARAQQLAARTGRRAEEVIGELADTSRGGTSALRSLGERGQRLAEQLDKLHDPAERAARATQLLDRELRRAPTAADEMRSAFARANLELESLGLGSFTVQQGLMALGGAATATTAAFVKFVADGIGKYVDTAPRAHAVTSAWEASLDRLQTKAGEVAWDQLELDRATTLWTARVDALTGSIDDLVQGYQELRAPVDEFLGQNTRLSNSANWAIGYVKILNPIGWTLTVLGGAANGLATGFDYLVGTEKEVAQNTRELARVVGSDGSTGFRMLGGAISSATAFLREFNDEASKITGGPSSGIPSMLGGGIGGAFNMARETFSRAKKNSRSGGGGGGGKVKEDPNVTAAAEAARALIAKAERIQKDRRSRAVLEGKAFGFEFNRGIGEARDAVDESLVGLERLAEATRAYKDALGLDSGISDQLQTQIDGIDRQTRMIEGANQAFTDLANGGIGLAVDAMGDFVSSMAAGSFSAEGFARGLIGSFGTLFRQAGTGLILLGSGIESIKTGVLAPAALIGIGTGLLLVGSAMEGFGAGAPSSGGGSAAQTASAVQSGFSQAADQLAASQQQQQQLTVLLELEGFERAVASAVNNGRDNRSIPNL